jgi:hypothetical protein
LFLEKMMRKLGFASRWVEIITLCVSLLHTSFGLIEIAHML